MPQNKLVEQILALPLYLKLIGGGAFVTIVSVFLPWYRDLDSFNTGDQFSGLSGPLYLLGFLVLLLAISSFSLSLMKAMSRPLPRLPIEESHAHIFSGASSLFFLLIVNSVYFHSKFGVNITTKEVRFGMIFAFIGCFIVLMGGILQNKKRGVSFDVQGKIDPLIEIRSSDRSQKSISENVQEIKETISINIENH